MAGNNQETENKVDGEIEDNIEVGKQEGAEDKNTSDETKNTEEQVDGAEGKIPYDRFKTKVDEVNALKEKLDRIERDQADKKRKELEDQNEYKELYEQAMGTISKQKEDALAAKKESLLSGAGYNDTQIKKLGKLVDGEDDDAIKASIEELKETFPTKNYVDPSLDNSQRSNPAKVDGEDVGRNLFDSLFKSGKIKGIKK